MHLRGLATALQHVAETDDLVHRIAVEVGGDRGQRDRVSVDVRDQCRADQARLRVLAPPLPGWARLPLEAALAEAGDDHRDRDRGHVDNLGRQLGAHGPSIAARATRAIRGPDIPAAG